MKRTEHRIFTGTVLLLALSACSNGTIQGYQVPRSAQAKNPIAQATPNQNPIVLLNEISRFRVKLDTTGISNEVKNIVNVNPERPSLSDFFSISDANTFTSDGILFGRVRMGVKGLDEFAYDDARMSSYGNEIMKIVNHSEVGGDLGLLSVFKASAIFFGLPITQIQLDINLRALSTSNASLRDGIFLQLVRGRVVQRPYHDYQVLAANTGLKGLEYLGKLHIVNSFMTGPHVYRFQAPDRFKTAARQDWLFPGYKFLEATIQKSAKAAPKCYQSGLFCEVFPVNGYVTDDLGYLEFVRIELSDISYVPASNEFQIFLVLTGRYNPSKTKSGDKSALKASLQEDYRDASIEVERGLAQSIFDQLTQQY